MKKGPPTNIYPFKRNQHRGNANCPQCREKVKTYEDKVGGTVTTEDGTRWHYNCYMEYMKELKDEKNS